MEDTYINRVKTALYRSAKRIHINSVFPLIRSMLLSADLSPKLLQPQCWSNYLPHVLSILYVWDKTGVDGVWPNTSWRWDGENPWYTLSFSTSLLKIRGETAGGNLNTIIGHLSYRDMQPDLGENIQAGLLWVKYLALSMNIKILDSGAEFWEGYQEVIRQPYIQREPSPVMWLKSPHTILKGADGSVTSIMVGGNKSVELNISTWIPDILKLGGREL